MGVLYFSNSRWKTGFVSYLVDIVVYFIQLLSFVMLLRKSDFFQGTASYKLVGRYQHRHYHDPTEFYFLSKGRSLLLFVWWLCWWWFSFMINGINIGFHPFCSYFCENLILILILFSFESRIEYRAADKWCADYDDSALILWVGGNDTFILMSFW